MEPSPLGSVSSCLFSAAVGAENHVDEELQGKQASTLVIFIWGSLNPSHLKCELELPQNTRRQSLKKHPWGGRMVLPKPGSSSLTRCAPRAGLTQQLSSSLEGEPRWVAGPRPCWLVLVGCSHQGPGGRPEGKRRRALPGQGCCCRAGPPAPAVSARGEPSCGPSTPRLSLC